MALGTISSGNAPLIETINLLADANNDLYVLASVPYSESGPINVAALHLRKYVGRPRGRCATRVPC